MISKLQNLKGKQLEVYDLYFNQGLSISNIAKRRGVTYQAINKTIKKLIKKGVIERGFKQGLKREMPIMMGGGSKYFRYHNLHLIIQPYYFFDRYSLVEKGFGIPFDKWTVTFNKKNIELQLKRHESFDSKEIDECRELAQINLTETLWRLGEKYGFEVFKEGKCNIKLVNQHLAEVENGIAKTVKDRWQIQGKDNKVWLLIDKSTGYIELEAVHPSLATDDMKVMEKYLNDWRENTPPNNSELLKQLVLVAKNQDIYNKNIELHLTVLSEMRDTLKDIRQGRGEGSKSHSPLIYNEGNSKPTPPNALKHNIRDSFPEGWFE